jgi:dTDP-4-amino-4,6-dideoxygalactose transaminase
MRRPIPCLDLTQQHQELREPILRAFSEVYDQGAFSGGPFVERFENSFAKFSGSANCIGVANGTVALHLAMLALDIGPGDEVIVPANTFIATAWGVTHAGATPVFVDCDDTWTIEPTAIESAISPRTKAVIGVHLYGQPFDVERVMAICESKKLALVEDAAQAQGATYQGRPVGTFGDLATYSFYPGKNLGACGEAGAVTTQSDSLAKHLRSLRNHGSTVRYAHDEIGYNYRMGGLEAASLQVKLQHLSTWNNRRRLIASRYRREMQHAWLTHQQPTDGAVSAHHLYVVMVSEKAAFIDHLTANGISPAFHYPIPCHLQKAYAHLGYGRGSCPTAEALADSCVSLPMFPQLTDEEVTHVIATVNSFRT